MHFIKAGKTTFSRAFNAKRRDFSRSLQVIPQNHSSLLLRHSKFIQNGHFYSTKSTEKEQNLNVQDTFQNVNDDVINVQGNGITESFLQTTGDAPWIGIQAAQTLIESMHTELGLPWWAALAGSGLAVRGALFPLFIYQMKAAQRLVTAQKDFKKLWSAFRYARTFIPRSNLKGQLDAVLLARKGSKVVMKKHNARPIQTVLGSFVHIPLFILMAYSARDMIRSGNYEGMDVGGFWIWSNLLEADETFLLPFLATSSTYLNLELSLRNRSDLWTWFGRKLQFLPILGFPLYASLPQGVFFYWLASSWFSLGQMLALRNTRFRKALGLRPRPTQAPSSTSIPTTVTSTSSSSSASSKAT